MTALTLTGVLVVTVAVAVIILAVALGIIGWALFPVERSSEPELERPWLNPNGRTSDE